LIANYPNVTGTSWVFDYSSYSSNMPYYSPPKTRRERELAQLLKEFEGNTKQLEHQLRVEQAFKKVLSDTKSRERRPHPSVRRGQERRMQTYNAALAARQASRRPSSSAAR